MSGKAKREDCDPSGLLRLARALDEIEPPEPMPPKSGPSAEVVAKAPVDRKRTDTRTPRRRPLGA
jgi:hypothetical protein